MIITRDQDKRELRVFLSSTFRDMQVERDYLIKQIFPEIRKACRERLVEFTEIDLRWGVTKEEAEQGKVIRICLEEIDRCRPYFMSFLGERYGWSPVDSDIEYKRELIEQFPVVEESLRAHKSVTEMEILHGVLDNPAMAGHSSFYFRAPELTQSLGQNSGSLADYLEDSASGKSKLIQLKDRIRASGLPLHENYPSVEALGERIKQDLLSVLDKRYPKDKVPTPLEAARLEHEAYATDRCKAYIPNPADSEALDQFIQSSQDKPLIISGESGLGKSALLAYWLTQFRKQNPNRFIIQHYAGISGDANAIAILRRIIAEIKERIQAAEELPVKPEDVIRDFPLWLARVRQSDPLLLILDGLNQIEAQNLNWLPSFWPPNVSLIVSTLPGDGLAELQSRGWSTWLIQPMNEARRNLLIKTYLQSYRKALSPEQTSKTAGAPQCGNPLFLRTLLEELRTFGVFEQLDTLIANYLQANSPAELFNKVLARMERDYGGTIVSSVMCVLLASRRGLSETELMGITGISRLDISTFLLALDYHLARRGGLLNFFHDYLRQAAKSRYLPTEVKQKSAHLNLANYFDQQALDARKAEELPWQWQQMGEWEKLKDCISDIPMFATLFSKDPYELLGYWLSMSMLYDPGACYLKTFAEWESRHPQRDDVQAMSLSDLGIFLSEFCANYSAAEPLFRRQVSIDEIALGPESLVTISSIGNLATLLKEKGDSAAAEPLLRRALSIIERTNNSENHVAASIINNLATLLEEKGDYAAAEPLLRRALSIKEKIGGPEDPYTASGLINLASLLHIKGDHDGADSLDRRALAIYEKILGPEHPNTALCLSNVAKGLHRKGDYTGAEPLYRRALAIREKVLGPDHPVTANSLIALAPLLTAKGDYDTAELLYRRALAIYERVLGSEHPETASNLNSLAGLIGRKGDYASAESLNRRALAIREKVLGSDHLDTASSLIDLACLIGTKGDYATAELLYRRALDIREKILGPEHPNIASDLSFLASLLRALQNYAAAEPLYRRALAIREKALGPEHPDTVATLNDLAILLCDTSDYTAAEPLYRRALAICEKVLGSEHPDTVSSLYRLARLLSSKGDHSAAEPLYYQALTIREKILGPEHPDIVSDLSFLASLLRALHNYAAAEPLYRRALAIREKVLGHEHSDTVTSLNDLANLLGGTGDYTGAEPLYRRALAIREKVLGPDHPDTANSLNALAYLLGTKGDYAAAEPLYRRMLSIRGKNLGPEHSDTATSLYYLAAVLCALHDYAAAEPLYRRVLAISEKKFGSDHPKTLKVRNQLEAVVVLKRG